MSAAEKMRNFGLKERLSFAHLRDECRIRLPPSDVGEDAGGGGAAVVR